MQFDIVFYHGGCPDGACAAWQFWRKNKDIKMIPIYERAKMIDVDVENMAVAIADMYFDEKIMLEIIAKSKHTLLIDHHQGATDIIEKIKDPKFSYVFDDKFAACQLAYKYYNNNELFPWIVEAIAARDLWKYSNEKQKPICDALHQKYGIMKPEQFEMMLDIPDYPDDLYQFGLGVGECRDAEVKKYDKSGTFCKLNGNNTTVYLTSVPRHLRSDIGNRLSNLYPNVDMIAMYVYDLRSDCFWISARTTKENINIGEIFKDFPDGGGHPKAAGFTIYGAEAEVPEKFAQFKGQTMRDYFIV